MAGNIKNLANGFILGSLTTSATTLNLKSGYGSTMPTVPFFLTLTPKAQLSTVGNSEIVKVTAVNTDALTIVRAQRGTTAKSFADDDVVSNGVYVEELSGVMRILGTMIRTNVVRDIASPTVGTWYQILQQNNTTPLTMTITPTTSTVYFDVMLAIWGADDGYREVKLQANGADIGEVLPMSYLKNGVAPGVGLMAATGFTPGNSYTITMYARTGTTLQVSHRNAFVRAYELI